MGWHIFGLHKWRKLDFSIVRLLWLILAIVYRKMDLFSCASCVYITIFNLNEWNLLFKAIAKLRLNVFEIGIFRHLLSFASLSLSGIWLLFYFSFAIRLNRFFGHWILGLCGHWFCFVFSFAFFCRFILKFICWRQFYVSHPFVFFLAITFFFFCYLSFGQVWMWE